MNTWLSRITPALVWYLSWPLRVAAVGICEFSCYPENEVLCVKVEGNLPYPSRVACGGIAKTKTGGTTVEPDLGRFFVCACSKSSLSMPLEPLAWVPASVVGYISWATSPNSVWVAEYDNSFNLIPWCDPRYSFYRSGVPPLICTGLPADLTPWFCQINGCMPFSLDIDLVPAGNCLIHTPTPTPTITAINIEAITLTATNSGGVCELISPYEYAYLSNLVYGRGVLSELNVNFPDWSAVQCSACASFSGGFYGQLFNKSGTYVFAIRGTNILLIGNDLADLSLAIRSNVTGFLSNYLVQAIAYLTTSLTGITTKCLTFTGHSLGAALAEILAGKYQSSSVGFENPGAASYLKGQSITIGNVTAYQASPNLINTLDTSAISTIYRVFPPYAYPSSMTQAINAILADVVGGILPTGSLLSSNLGLQLIPEYIEYTYQQHDMSNILMQFDPETGQPYVFSMQTNGWDTFSVQKGFFGFF